MASFVISLVMARLLTPSDFGVFAVAMAVTAFLMHVTIAVRSLSPLGKREKIEPGSPFEYQASDAPLARGITPDA